MGAEQGGDMCVKPLAPFFMTGESNSGLWACLCQIYDPLLPPPVGVGPRLQNVGRRVRFLTGVFSELVYFLVASLFSLSLELQMDQLDLLYLYLRSFDEGRIILSTGVYEWKITTKGKPKAIWFGQTADQNLDVVPTCQGVVNKFGATMLTDGFILHAEVNTAQTEIFWQALLDTSNEVVSLGLVRPR